MQKFLGAIFLIFVAAVWGVIYYFAMPFLAEIPEHNAPGGAANWALLLIYIVMLLTAFIPPVVLGFLQEKFELETNKFLAVVCALLAGGPATYELVRLYIVHGHDAWTALGGILFGGPLVIVITFAIMAFSGSDRVAARKAAS